MKCYIEKDGTAISLAASIIFFHNKKRKKLICHTWKLIGIKNWGKVYFQTDSLQEKFISFNKNGTYSENMLQGLIQTKGKWRINDDSKLLFEITALDGNPMSDIQLEEKKPTDSIITLNRDTFVYTTFYYQGGVYCHNEMYFLRVKD